MSRIAIIGSGMAGLAAGWMLRRAGHEVILYEAQARRGMDAHTLIVETALGRGLVDVPLRVMSPHAWRSVLALCAEVGVESFPVDTFAAFTWRGGRTWLRTDSLRVGRHVLPWLGSVRFVNRDSAAVGVGLARLALSRDVAEGLTLDDFARQQHLPDAFLRAFLLPLLGTICTCDEATLRAWPARDLLALFRQILFGKTLRRLRGGTPALVDRLVAGLELRAPERVASLTEVPTGVAIATQSGHRDTFDFALCATQANQTSFLDPARFAREREVLGRFRYASGALVVHTDERLMPPRRDDWSALNYLIEPDLSSSLFTVWVNPVEPSLRTAEPVFQTWLDGGPTLEPRPEATLAHVKLQRAVVGLDTRHALTALETLHAEARRRVFFCGSWASPGVPLLESAVRSALTIAGHLGIAAPWAPPT